VALSAIWRTSPRTKPGLVSLFNPECRLLCLALLSSALLFAGWAFAAFVTFTAIILLAFEGISPARALRESSFVLAFAIFTALAKVWGQTGAANPSVVLAEAFGYGLKLLAAFLACRLFYASTKVSELRDACTRLTRRVPFLRFMDLGLAFSMVLGYLPLIVDEWDASLEAARSRGLPKRPGIRRQAIFIIAFIRRLMLSAISVPEALLARAWTKDRFLSASQWKCRDGIAIALSVAVLAVSLLGHV
jgi:energy-coupling factor transporter transmembrane protein EcfT